MSPRVYIVLLNWNGWHDTTECLESLFGMDASNYTVVVCDNSSADDSYLHLRLWAARRRRPQSAPQAIHARRQFQCSEWTPGETPSQRHREADLILIQTGANLGFAGGCNVGLRFVLACQDAKFVWLLNNDTIVAPDALNAQTNKMASRPEVGILGAKLMSYHHPEVVQCRAGYGFNFWFARVRPIAIADSGEDEETQVERSLRYISGASMFVRRQLLEQVGLMNEQYFLYYEELDWATRARGQFTLGYCANALVYHKEGQSIGSSSDRQQRSSLSERYLTRNRVLFTKTYLPWHLPSTVIWVCFAALARLLQGRGAQTRTMLCSLWEGLQLSTIKPLGTSSQPIDPARRFKVEPCSPSSPEARR